MNADAKFDPLILRHGGILFGHAALDFNRTSRTASTALANSTSIPSPGSLDDVAAMRRDCGVNKRFSDDFKPGKRAFFVGTHQAAISRHIRRKNRRQSPFHALFAQDAPRPGKSNNYLAEKWADVRLPMSELGHSRRFDRTTATSGLPR